MSKATFPRQILRSAFALTALFSATAVLNAQTTTQTSSTTPAAQVSLQVPAIDTSKDALFSSSAAENSDAPVVEASLVPTTPNFAEMMQYGGRDRGRRPRYRGANTNPDGSNKWTGYGGFGFEQPVGNTWHYYTPSWGLQAGFGRQWSKYFALPIEFDYDHLGLTGQNLSNQLNVYNTEIAAYDATLADGTADPNYVAPYASLDGNAHVWSFSLDPTVTFFQGPAVGAYVVAGVGFYHKVTNFTTPVSGCDPYYLYYYGVCYPETQNAIVEHFTSNAPGFNAGFGVTYKFSRFSNEKFYGEVRYVYIDNSQRYGATAANINTGNNIYDANDYPANSNRTSYFPVKFGIRF